MFAKLESYLHHLRHRLSRNEWAIKHLGLTPSEGTSEEPGLLLIQIDGFSKTQLQRALAANRMPFLKRLLQREGYEQHTFYPGLPTTTPAVQAELYYGVRSAVPAFSFYDRVLKKVGRMWDPEWAKAREAASAKKAEGLLTGGSSWSNIYTGGAGQWESHFCAASIGIGDMWRTKKVRNIFLFIVLNLTAALRIAWMLLVEFGIAFVDMVQAIFRGRRPYREFLLMVSRVFVGTGLRELLTISGQIDVLRGLPIVHINFVGYDEEAHVRGPGSRLAHYSLRGIDRAIKHIARAAHRSRRRDYAVWIFSDHGQEAVRAYPNEVEGGIEATIERCLELSRQHEAWRATSAPWKSSTWLSRGRINQARIERNRVTDALRADEEKTFTVAAMGPVAHIYFAEPRTDEQRMDLAKRLIETGKLPGVLLRTKTGEAWWFHAQGKTALGEGMAALLPHPPAIAQEIARDLPVFLKNPDVGDLTIVGWSPWGEKPVSFAPEYGAHGGFGPEETQGFALLPAHTRLPAGTEHFIRPEALRTAALNHIGRGSLESGRKTTIARRTNLRLMTYNIHGCGGTDGRVSPRRVARAIMGEMPDIVALQEVDLGRRRSRVEDQAQIIAKETGMQVTFCPTVTRDTEHYGHALLSRWPMEVVKRARLPHDPKSWWQEARSAIWVRVLVDEHVVNVITTHLGLGMRERVMQIEALLGPEWIGGIPEGEPVLLCGDFNAMPGTAPYRLAAAQMTDVQLVTPKHRPRSTFSSWRPLMRIDHIFASKHFTSHQVRVVRNSLTRVASDHLPLVADLQVGPSVVDTSKTTRPRSAAHTPPAQPVGPR